MAPLKVGMVGAGGIASGAHLPAWTEIGAEVTIHSADGRAPALAEGFAAHDVRAVDSFDALLDGCDVVDICTPTFTHAEIALQAIASGKHVICEKPLALTVREAEEVVQAARDAGVQVYPGHVVRFFPAYAALQQAVASGDVGEPVVLRFTRAGAYPLGGQWFSDTELSGGILLDQMIHDMDFARWLAGDVVRVHAQTVGGATGTPRPGDVATGTAVLTHAGGAISHVAGVWGHQELAFRTTFRISGTDGVLEYDSTARVGFRALAQRERKDGEYIPGSPLHESPMTTQLREFATAIAGGPEPRVSAEDGIEAVRIGLACLESAKSGKAVDIVRDGATTSTGGVR